MKPLPPDFIEKSRAALVDNLGTTLQDVRDKVAKEPAGTSRRDCLSALDAVPTLFGKDLSKVQASAAGLRGLFCNDHMRMAKSRKRVANIRSAITNCVKRYGDLIPSLTNRIRPTEPWQSLLGRVENSDYASSLRKLACFCTIASIEPEMVRSEILLGFYEALVEEELVTNPKRTLSLAISYWNYHQKRVAEWPTERLSSPFPGNSYRLPLETFPSGFQAELNQWRALRLPKARIGLRGGNQARKVTVDQQTANILRFATLLVKHNTVRLEEMTGFSVLVQPDIVEAGLYVLLEDLRRDIKYVHQYAQLLAGLAKHHVNSPPDSVSRLRDMARTLRKERKRGLCEKSASLVKEFVNETMFKRLRSMPAQERTAAKGKTNLYRIAKHYERALIAEILFYTSLRIKNVCMIEIERHLHMENCQYSLRFNKDEMKGKREHDLSLPAQLSANINEFISRYRPTLSGSNGPYLFPGKGGDKPKHHSTIRSEYERITLKYLGRCINPHSIRHITSQYCINKDESSIFDVSRRLAHTKVDTTREFYLCSDSNRASRALNKMLDGDTAPEKPTSSKRVSRK